jgi:NTP pyrophosphatase (non-canonical NTP hydrolase)
MLSKAIPSVTLKNDIVEAEDGITVAQFLCHKLAKTSGWWDNTDPTDKVLIASKLCLIHSEISEALEGVRKDTKDSHLPHRLTVEVELADAMIRIFDLAGAMDLDLSGAILEKLAYNQERADHKRENRAADGGKKI